MYLVSLKPHISNYDFLCVFLYMKVSKNICPEIHILGDIYKCYGFDTFKSQLCHFSKRVSLLKARHTPISDYDIRRIVLERKLTHANHICDQKYYQL